MIDLRADVSRKVDSLRDYLIATTQELVRIPSINHPPTGEEYACQMVVDRCLQEMGLTPEVYELDRVPGLREHKSFWPGRDYAHRPNVVARRKGSGGGRSLVLSGHIDTVPLGTRPWSHDPFAAEIQDGKLYGLGSYDMKGGVALILGVMRTLQELGVQLKGDLLAETIVDEEFGGVNGTLAGRVRGDNGDAMIITEPSGLSIYNGVRGGWTAHLTLSGAEGILFQEEEPGQATRQLAHLLRWVDILRERRRARVPNWRAEQDPVPVWITKIYSGAWSMDAPITVPAEIKVELYWQFLPGEEQAQAHAELFAWLSDMVADKPNDFVGIPKVEFPLRFMPASEISPDASIIQALKKCALSVTGQVPSVGPLPAPSDLFVVQRDFGIPAVHYGVRGGGAHAADEYLLVEDLTTATKVLTQLAIEWCEVV